jgi:hypothetical protein
MNTTTCPACLSQHVGTRDRTDGQIDCFACGLWFDPCHPHNQPASPWFGREYPADDTEEGAAREGSDE